MALFSRESVERVRDATDFAALVGARTELRRAGARRLQGLCPFHEERTPSFGIDPVEKLFKCFGCGEAGDLFSFVMKTEALDFPRAVEWLADRAGVELEREDEDPAEAARRARRGRLHELLDRTATYYERLLWESPEAADARAYLLGRGLTSETLRAFRVGYAPSRWDRVLLASRRAGYSESELLAAGLVSRSRGGGPAQDRFRERIMFPLADFRGRIVGFGARRMRENQHPAKYLNSPEGELFHKNQLLYGAHLARAEAARAAAVVLVEGYTDVIALHQGGIVNAVAQMGTSLTEEQVRELGRLAPVVLLCLDADTAGQEAMLRAARVAAASKLELRVVPMPVGSDPADLLAAEGTDGMRSRLASAIPFPRFQVERALATADIGTVEGRDRVLPQLASVITSLPPTILRDDLVRLVAGRLALSERLTEQLLEQTRAAAPDPFAAAPSRASGPTPRAPGGSGAPGGGGARGTGASPRQAGAPAAAPQAAAPPRGAGPRVPAPRDAAPRGASPAPLRGAPGATGAAPDAGGRAAADRTAAGDAGPGADSRPAPRTDDGSSRGRSAEAAGPAQQRAAADPVAGDSRPDPDPGDLGPDWGAASAEAIAGDPGPEWSGGISYTDADAPPSVFDPGPDGGGSTASAGRPPHVHDPGPEPGSPAGPHWAGDRQWAGGGAGRGGPGGGDSAGRGGPGGRVDRWKGRGGGGRGGFGQGGSRRDRPGGFGDRDAPAQPPGPPAASVAFERRDSTERSFLAHCLALPDHGERRLADLDIDAHFTAALTRRAAEYLRRHIHEPAKHLPPDDQDLSAFIADLALGGHGAEPDLQSLHAEQLQLELLHLERQIAARPPNAIELVATRQRLREELRRATMSR